MSEKVFFEYKRLPPNIYPEPRNIRVQLQKIMISKYKDKLVSDIPLATELILKTIKPKDLLKAEKILLKYQILNIDWDILKVDKNSPKFNSKMFKWIKNEETNNDDF